MSDHLAIGGVSLTLKALLEDRMAFADSSLGADKVTVTVSAPDVVHNGITGPRLNLFLYHISENAFLKNQEIPGHGHPGTYGHPPLSLDLHFLITTYSKSDQDDVLAHRVLGDAMRVFNDFALVSHSLMRQRSGGAIPILDASLLSEYERLKIVLEPLSLDDNSKIWLALPQTNYRCSVAYQVTVIQIESESQRSAPLAVRDRRVFVYPFVSPQITEIFRDPPIDGIKSPVAAAGESIVIRGVNLGGPGKRATIGGIDVSITSQKDDEIVAIVPASVPAGAHPLQVFQDIVLGVTPGKPLEPHTVMASNAVAVLVIPTITGPANPISAGAGATVQVSVSPNVNAGQQVEVLLGDNVLPASLVPPGASSSATLQFVLPSAPALPAGMLLLRVRVDGAESRLSVDPVTNIYNGPNFTVT